MLKFSPDLKSVAHSVVPKSHSRT